MAGPTHPFTKTDLAKINAALNSLDVAEKIIARAKAAGFDVAAYDADCKACKDRLQGIKEHFFSLKPAS